MKMPGYFSLLAVLFALSGCSGAPSPETKAPAQGAAVPAKPCTIPLGWSEDPKPFFINPNDPAPADDCDFHLWSWSAFIFWTLPDASGQPKFLSLPTFADLEAGKAPAAGTRKLSLTPRVNKTDNIDEFQQAGSNGLLVDQNGRAVYYSQHFDPTYFQFAQEYYGKANYQKATPDTMFPMPSTVFKVSWRIVQPGEDTSSLFTTDAEVAVLANNPKGGVMVTNKMMPARVAMIGMHVVGVIKDHPEMAWGTFEHARNAPDLPADMLPSSDQPVSADNFTFYKAGTAAKDCNQNPKTALKVTDPDKQILAPVTHVFRQFAQGGGDAENTTDIKTLNTQFTTDLKGRKSVFANYLLNGTVWELPNSLKPNDDNMDKDAKGSSNLANATMETFVQGSGTNCFSCHNTTEFQPRYPGKDINLSHAILAPFFTSK